MQETEPDRPKWAILQPFVRAEAQSTAAAAKADDCSSSTIRRRCEKHGIGRRFGGEDGTRGHWLISRVARRMLREGDRPALRLYLSGDRSSARVREYFAQEGCLRQLDEVLAAAERESDRPKRQTMLRLLGEGA
jgi:hypothetical protein